MTTLRLFTYEYVDGASLYYEAKVSFSRFASIFNVKKQSMI